MDGLDIEELARLWREGQRAFWSAAAGAPISPASAAAPEPAAFEGFWSGLLAGAAPPGRGEGWLALAEAGARYRGVVLAAWGRVHEAFDLQRRAMIDPQGPPPDWRLLRDRWLAIAEAEFIRTQRSDAFLDAQRAALRAVVRWREELPEDERAMVLAGRSAARAGARLAAGLELDGVRIATTPKDAVWRRGKTSLARYRPLAGPPGLGPLVICSGLFGRQTMTDLTPERSLVRNLLAAGVDVFVLDWGDAGPEDAGNNFDHYADRLLGEALAAALAISGAARAALLGICQGGTFAVCRAARRDAALSGVILAVTPVDFHADAQDADPAHGLLNLWVRSLETADLEGLAGFDGNLPGELTGLVFNQLNPVRTLAKYAVELPELADDPPALAMFLAMEKWLADRPDLPGALARSWLVDLYHRNALSAGRFRVAGEAIDLRRIEVPVLNVFATGDHIIPPPCSRALGRFVAPRLYSELALPTGHVGVFVSARAQALLAPAIAGWLRALPVGGA